MAAASDNLSTRAEPFLVAGCAVEPTGLQITTDGQKVRVEAKVMLVLVYLADHAGRVVSRAELEEQIWPGRVVTEDSVIKAIAKLRRVFRDDAHDPRIIETIPKRGYRLIAEVTQASEAQPSTGSPASVATAEPLDKRTLSIRWVVVITVVLSVLFGLWHALDWQRTRPPTLLPKPDRPAVAVMPFENLGRMPDDDFFANGITADLITDLSKLKGLLVIAPSSAFAYRDAGTETAEVSSELGVDYLVTGTVQRRAQSLRINVNLIEAHSGRAMWGQRYAGQLQQVFGMQDRIIAGVVAALELELAPAEQHLLTGHPTTSIVAYDAYLRGFEAHGRRSEGQNLVARHYFEEAVELDPEFARAHAGLALTYSREAIDGWTPDPSHALVQAARHAEQASDLDASLPQVHFVAGQVRLFQRMHTKAVAAAERAIDLDPNYADAFALLAWTLNYSGRPAKAMSALNMAMRLNPRPPASYLEILGEIYFAQNRFEDSASTFQQVLDINPAYLRARLWNAAALVLAGFPEKAAWELDEALIASPDLSTTRLAFAFPFMNPRTEEKALNALRIAGLRNP
jgi:TolB-like protein/DNA-binding winged helix-turn-helix (wHTH) protein